MMMLAIVGFAAVVLLFQHYSEDLPDYEQLAEYAPPVVTRLYASDGRLLAEYAKEKRIFLPLKAIPKMVQQAFIAAEDKHFYQHKGVDIFGIARAVRENVQNYGTGRRMVGGSTITQQVVKNFLLSSEKSLERKIKEAILAYRISHVYDKNKILELYLNEIYLGKGSYGVAAAAVNYFNKSLDELEVAEAALLAALPKAPARYNPAVNKQAAQQRRDYVINRMLDDDHISDIEAARAKATPVITVKRPQDQIASADFFAEEVRRKLAAMYGANVLYEGGLTVKTTVEPDVQAMADDALRGALMAYDRRYGYRGPVKTLSSIENWEIDLPKITESLNIPLFGTQQFAVVLANDKEKSHIGLPDGSRGTIPLNELKWARKDAPKQALGPVIKKPGDVLSTGDIILVDPLPKAEGQYGLHQIPKVNGGMVVMDPHTGRVMAMSGGYAYSKSEFNRATQARRQPGSAFKPFVYMAALESGFTPSTQILDAPIEVDQGPNKPKWKPQNYGGNYLGATTLRRGIEKSRNAMTVRLAQMIGLGRIIRIARRFGIYEDLPRNFSMTLGAHETTLIRLTSAYAMVANGGKRVKPHLIERIDDYTGKIIYRRDNRECTGCMLYSDQAIVEATPPRLPDVRETIVDPRIAYQITSMLQGVVQRGTATRANTIGKPVAGKTGTTNDSRDTWFIGFSPDLVTGVYIGYDQPRSLGRKETGSKVALPAFIDFMKTALKDTPATPFRVPPGIMMVKVDRKTGLPPSPGMEHGRLITEAFLVGGSIFKPSEERHYADEEINMDRVYEDEFSVESRESGWEDVYGWSDVNTTGYSNSYGMQYEPPAASSGWQDQRYYMTPGQARYREQQLQQQYRRPAPTPTAPSPSPSQSVPSYNQPQQSQNPYNTRQRERYRQTYQPNNSGAANYGTGGLY